MSLPGTFTAQGEYQVLRRLGEGSMGAVYLAEHRIYGYRVALKRLHGHLSHHEELVIRFLAEAEAAARIRHPGMVDVFESGVDERGTPYLVMDYLEGETLERRLARRRVSIVEVIDLGRQIAATLTAAHRAGIVHRDLKPENVFLIRNPAAVNRERVKVLDFGVAKFLDDQHTTCGSFFGTPHYMSPEQARGASCAGAPSDIYALGCVLYHLASGKLPFSGTLEQVIEAHRGRAPVPPSAIECRVPIGLESLILRMMAKRSNNRPATMLEVEAELASLGESLQQFDTDVTGLMDAA